jgi:hypothetical protein
MGQLATYPLFRAFDRDGEPLAGGKVYSYLSGTSTPHALFADADLTTPLENPVILDSSGEAEFYYNGSLYKLLLTDKDDVEQWLLDPVSGAGSTGLPGLGMGTNTVLIRPSAGVAAVSAAAFPADVLGIALTVKITESFGTSQGLEAMGVGSPSAPDLWGVLTTLTAAEASTAGDFLVYSGQPQPQPGPVTLTAYGGLFDGTGALYVTAYFFSFAAPTTPGMSYLPGAAGDPLPPTPQPPASETTMGIAEIATTAETTTGTDNSRIISPLRLKEQLDPVRADVTALEAKLPAGTALSVARYATSGTALESAPGLATTSTAGQLVLGAAAPTPDTLNLLLVQQNGGAGVRIASAAGAPGLSTMLAGTSLEAPSALPTNTLMSYVGAAGYDGTAYSPNQATIQVWTEEAWTATTRGTSIRLATTTLGTITRTERLRLDAQGNLRTSGTSTQVAIPGTGAVGVLALKEGVAPTGSHPADAVQLWTANRGAVAGKGSLHLRTEDGTQHVLGDLSGHGTLCDATLGSGASYQTLTIKGSLLTVGQSSTQERAQGLVSSSWVVATDATRTARLTVSAYDATAAREGMRLEADGAAARIGFLGAAAVVRQTLPVAATDSATTQSLANSLRTALLNLGLAA